MRKIAIAILSLFFLFALLAGVLQSPWGKEKAIALLTEALNDSGLRVEIGEVRGALPHQVDLKDVKIDAGGYEISFGSLEVRISLLRLLKKEIAFTEVKGERISWIKKEGTPPLKKGGIPFLLNVEHFQLTDVSIPGLFTAGFEGYLRVGKKNRTAFLDATVRRPGFPDSEARLLLSIQKNGTAIGKLDLKTPTLDALPFSPPVDGALDAECHISGHWTALFEKKGPLQVRVQGTFSPVSVPFPLFLEGWFEQDWAFNGQFYRNEDQTWRIAKLGAKSDFFNVKGSGALDAQGKISQAQFQIQSTLLSLPAPLPLSGRLFANLNLHEEGEAVLAKATWRIPVLTLSAYRAEDFQGSAEGKYESGALTASATLSADFLSQKWEGSGSFSWAAGSPFLISQYRIESPPFEIKGDLAIRPDWILSGTTEFSASQIHSLSESLYGKISGKAAWAAHEQNGGIVQALHLDGKGSDFYWNAFFAEEATLYSDLLEPFKNIEGTVFLDLEKARWGGLALSSASLETAIEGENWPFRIEADGEWKHPLAVQLGGFWRYNRPDLAISLQSAAGSFFNHPLLLKAPASFEWSPTVFRLRDLLLGVADASLAASIDRQLDKTDAHLAVDRLPLDFLSVNPLDVAVAGLFSLDASLKERGDRLEGEMKASVEQMEVLAPGQLRPLNAGGAFEAAFDEDRLDLKGRLTVRETPLLELDLSLPVHLEVWPFEGELLLDKSAKGHFALNGRIEDFLDFFDLGTHRLEGECNADLSFSNTLAHPLLSGTCDFEDGTYQNYYTGTELQNIRAGWLAEKNTLYLRSLTAQDAKEKGSLSATGQIDMIPGKLIPFRFDAEFARLNCAAFDLMTVEAGGKIHIAGNWEQAVASGKLEILESDIAVPDRIPRQLPNLQVVYKNAAKPPEFPQPPQKAPYPLHLDLDVDAPDGIFISGRGLNSEWKGNFHVGGVQTAIEAKGSIELIKGDFLFSGRRFKLTEGALSFSGVPNEMPFLNLAGTMEVKDVAITARLKGPLNNPQVTLQSVPPLPMGTIMAYLLFGQDMSEINSVQALQLANSLSSIAGEGPDVLEATRRSLGVDRLRIINVPSTTEEGENAIAVQVGKYVAEGVIVSYAQGAEDSSGNISIEVELKGGMTFQLESDQAQEQGKFTLRWSHNY